MLEILHEIEGLIGLMYDVVLFLMDYVINCDTNLLMTLKHDSGDIKLSPCMLI